MYFFLSNKDCDSLNATFPFQRNQLVKQKVKFPPFGLIQITLAIKHKMFLEIQDITAITAFKNN